MSTLTPTVQPHRAASLRSLIVRHPLVAFFALAYGLTWGIYLIPLALSVRGILPFEIPMIVAIVGGYCPTIAALLVTWASNGKEGVRSLLRGLLIWRVGVQWYLVVLFLFPLLFVIGFRLYGLLGGTPPALPQPSIDLAMNVVMMLVVLGIVNGEEIGWRGFALPRMQARHSPLIANLLLGLLWAAFHLPLFWTPGSPQREIGLLAYPLITVMGGILFGWIYNNTRGSLLLAYLFHAAQNTWTQILPIGTSGPLFWFPMGMMTVAAVLVVIVYGPRLTRKPESEIPRISADGRPHPLV